MVDLRSCFISPIKSVISCFSQSGKSSIRSERPFWIYPKSIYLYCTINSYFKFKTKLFRPIIYKMDDLINGLDSLVSDDSSDSDNVKFKKPDADVKGITDKKV